jgi:hypothetical protein
LEWASGKNVPERLLYLYHLFLHDHDCALKSVVPPE